MRFESMGEALDRVRRASPALASRIGGLHDAIAFRGVLIHGHDAVEDAVAWNGIRRRLP